MRMHILNLKIVRLCSLNIAAILCAINSLLILQRLWAHSRRKEKCEFTKFREM